MRVEPADVGSAESVEVLKAYFTDVVSRFHRRPATNDEVAAVMADETSERLMPPDGAFLVARGEDGNVVGCIGLRSIDTTVGEIKRMFVVPEARGRGHARTTLAHLERTAAEAGARAMILETGTAQPEAIALYESSGYVLIPSFGYYSWAPENRCFGKPL